MKRRNFLISAAPALASASMIQEAQETAKISRYLLRYYYLRSGPQVDRTIKYLSSVYLPAAKRAGAGPAGFFNAVIADRSPFVLALITAPSADAMDAMARQMASDKEFVKGTQEFDSIPTPGGEAAYVRIETTVLRAFERIPTLDIPPARIGRPARIFELRTYESPSESASRRKIKMFEDGEAAIFRRLGMMPVFFGQTIAGRNMPSLTYMLAFDDLASREKLWSAFGADPEWRKLRAQPGLSDPEIVSNISNSIVRPLGFSDIR